MTLWDVGLERPVRSFQLDGVKGDVVALSDDGRWVAAGIAYGVQIFDTRDGSDRKVSLPFDVRKLVFSRDGGRLGVAHDKGIAVVDSGGGAVLAVFPAG